MLNAGHFHYCFFESSETFIYNQLKMLQKYRPVAISLISKNLHKKSLKNGSLYDVGFRLPRSGMQFIQPFRYYALKLAAELFKREQISLLHAHFGTWGSYVLPLKRKLKVPMLVTFYGLDVSLLPKKHIWRSRYQKLWAETDLILAEGPFMISALAKLGAPPKKLKLQRIGIPIEKLAFTPPSSSSKRLTALWAGRMVEKKGLLDAIKAIALLKQLGADIELRIVGNGEQKEQAETLVSRIGLTSRVKFLGFLDYSSYLEEFRSADFFIAPSKTSTYGETEGGAPTTIIEAQARGLPVVATKHADIPFILPKGYPYLAQENNPKSLASTVLRLIEDKKRWNTISRENRSFVKKYHDISVTIDTLEEYYDSLVKKD